MGAQCDRMAPRQPKRESKMSKKIVEVKQYIDFDNTPESFYTVKDDNRFILCNGGGVFFTSEEYCQKMIDDDEPMDIPHSNSRELDIMEVDGIIGVYDWNMNCLYTGSLDDIIEAWKDDENRFTNIAFPNDDDYDDDYSGNDDYYDNPPSYYDARYDGPMHYIPPGNH